MAFVQNGVRKPKYVAQIVIKKSLMNNKNFKSDKITCIAAIRQFVCGKIDVVKLRENVAELSGEAEKILNEVQNQYKTLSFYSEKKNVNVYLTTSGAGRGKVLINIYLIEAKNVLESSRTNDYSFKGDHIVLSPKAWFEDHEVFQNKYTLFFNKKTEKLIVAIHPKDLEDLKADKNCIMIAAPYVSVCEKRICIEESENVQIYSAKDRQKEEIAKQNQSRIVAQVKSSAVKSATHKIRCYSQNDKVKNGVMRHVTFVNIAPTDIDALKDGKYQVYDEVSNKVYWMVVTTVSTFLNSAREVILVEDGMFGEKIESVSEISVIELLKNK